MNRVCCLVLFLAALPALAAEEAKTPRTDLYGDPLPPGAVMRLGTTRLRHARADMVFSKDGKRLISCSRNGDVRIWDVATGKLLRRTELTRNTREEEPFTLVRLSPDGAAAANESMEGVLLHDTATGAKRGRVRKRSHYYCPLIIFSPDGKRLIVQNLARDYPAVPQVWDVADLKKRCILDCAAALELHDAAFSPDGKRLAGTAGDDKIHLWNADTGAEIRRGEQRSANAGGLAFSPDGAVLAVGTTEGREVHLLDAVTLREKEKPLQLPSRLASGNITGLQFSPDGRWLAGKHHGGDDPLFAYDVILWDRKGEKEARRVPGRFEGNFAFAPDSKTLAYDDGLGSAIHLIDLTSGRELLPRYGHDTAPRLLTVSPDGKTIASAVVGRAIYLWDVDTGKLLRSLAVADETATAILFTPDVRWLISAGERGSFQVWKVSDGSELRRFACFPQGELVSYHAVHISADGRRLQAILSKQDTTETTASRFAWELASGKRWKKASYALQRRVERDAGMVWWWTVAHAAFAPDGETMTAWREGRVRLEEVSTGSLRATLPPDVGRPLLFSPDGRLVAAAILQPSQNHIEQDRRKGVSLLESATGAEIARLEIGAWDYAAFTPDSRGLVVADKKKLRVWDTDTGERRQEMAWPKGIVDGGGEANICSLAILADGRAVTGLTEGDILI